MRLPWSMRSKAQFAVAIALIGCKSRSMDSASASEQSVTAVVPPITSDASTPRGRLALPEVSAADAVITPSGPTPLLVVVDKSGKMAFGVGSDWNALASYDPAAAVRDEDLDDVGKLLSEARMRHMTPSQTVAAFRGSDAPPPAIRSPAEPAESDDAHHMSALDEGKMGKRVDGSKRTKHDDNDVSFAVTGDINDRIDDAYRAKYARSPYLAPMIGARARAATVKVVPDGGSS